MQFPSSLGMSPGAYVERCEPFSRTRKAGIQPQRFREMPERLSDLALACKHRAKLRQCLRRRQGMD